MFMSEFLVVSSTFARAPWLAIPLVGGLLVAVLAAVVPIVQAALGDVQWSSAWWLALLNAVLSPALYAVVAYVGRPLKPPV